MGAIAGAGRTSKRCQDKTHQCRLLSHICCEYVCMHAVVYSCMCVQYVDVCTCGCIIAEYVIENMLKIIQSWKLNCGKTCLYMKYRCLVRDQSFAGGWARKELWDKATQKTNCCLRSWSTHTHIHTYTHIHTRPTHTAKNWLMPRLGWKKKIINVQHY